jgi:hypothetical protein
MATKFQYNGGAANYIFEHEAPPAWLVAAIPGAASARKAWQAANAAGAEVRRDLRRSTTELLTLRASNPLAAELETATRAHQDVQDRLDAATRNSLAKLRAFDATITGADLGDIRKVAATFALERQAEIEAAWSTLHQAALDRDAAYAAMGQPGIPWTERGSLGARSEHGDGGRQVAFAVMNAIVHGFPTSAVAEVREGTDAPRPPAPPSMAGLSATERRIRGFE